MGKGIVKLGEGNWAVKDGNLLAAKETNGRFKNTEFTVARGTKASYVGRDGLIKESNLQDANLVQNGDFEELGDDVITNGDFSTSGDVTTSSFSLGWKISASDNLGVSIANNQLLLSRPVGEDTDYGRAYATNGVNSINVKPADHAGKVFKLEFEIVAKTGTPILRWYNNGYITFSDTTLGKKTIYFTSSTNRLVVFLQEHEGSSITLDNISLKQVDPNDRWSKDASWSISDGKAIYDGSTNGHRIRQNVPLTIGKVYKATLDILDNSGRFRISVDGGSLSYNTYTSGNGTYTFYFTSTSVEFFVRGSMSDSANTFSIDNVYVKEVKTDTPRIDFTDNTDGHLLLEPTSENKVTYSEDFSEWTNTDITFGADGVSPSGETNANLIQTGTAGNDQVSNVFTLSATNTTTYSVFIKRVSGAEWIDFLIVKSGFSNSLKVWFNINNGTVGSNNATGTTTLDSTSIEDYGNDWYRLIVTTTDSTNNTSFNIRVRTASADGSDTRVDNSSYYLWGMQLEELSYPTSYIPTNGSTVTRDADTCTDAGEAIDFNSEEGVLYAEIARSTVHNDYELLSISPTNNSDGTHYASLGYNNTDNKLWIRAKMGNTVAIASIGEVDTVLNQFYKIAIKYKSGENAIFVDGQKLINTDITDGSETTTFTATPNTISDLEFRHWDANNSFYGKVKAIRVYKEALSDSELTTLTS